MGFRSDHRNNESMSRSKKLEGEICDPMTGCELLVSAVGGLIFDLLGGAFFGDHEAVGVAFGGGRLGWRGGGVGGVGGG